MKNKKIRLSANKGTILADLLEYTQGLIKKGDSSSAHKLQEIIQNSSVEPRNKEENGSNIYLANYWRSRFSCFCSGRDWLFVG